VIPAAIAGVFFKVACFREIAAEELEEYGKTPKFLRKK